MACVRQKLGPKGFEPATFGTDHACAVSASVKISIFEAKYETIERHVVNLLTTRKTSLYSKLKLNLRKYFMKTNIHNLRKNEQGFAHIFLVLLVFLVVAGIGGLAVWRISSYRNNSGDNAKGSAENDGSGNNSATASDACIAQTHDANICHLGAIDGPDKHASVVKVTMQTDNGSQVWTEKFDGKGNNSVESGEIQGISLNGHQYVLLGSTWIDYGGSSTQAPSAPAVPALATTAGIKYTNQGKAACGSDTCYKYTCTGGILGKTTVLVTFGTKDYLPRHYEVTTPAGETSLLGNMTMDISYGPVTITAPAGAITLQQYQQQALQ
jgi:hypothetical protein